jgi:8-oxo-dGTP pyrophosphatase MutT (NUDIX family)
VNPIRNSLKAIIIRGGKLLVIGKEDADGMYYLLPGGGQMPGERFRETLERECREEIGAPVAMGPLRFIREYIGRNHEFAAFDGDVHQVDLMFACNLVGDYAEAASGHEPDTGQVGVYWLELERLMDYRLYPMVLRPLLMDSEGPPPPVYLGDVN